MSASVIDAAIYAKGKNIISNQRQSACEGMDFIVYGLKIV